MGVLQFLLPQGETRWLIIEKISVELFTELKKYLCFLPHTMVYRIDNISLCSLQCYIWKPYCFSCFISSVKRLKPIMIFKLNAFGIWWLEWRNVQYWLLNASEDNFLKLETQSIREPFAFFKNLQTEVMCIDIYNNEGTVSCGCSLPLQQTTLAGWHFYTVK